MPAKIKIIVYRILLPEHEADIVPPMKMLKIVAARGFEPLT